MLGPDLGLRAQQAARRGVEARVLREDLGRERVERVDVLDRAQEADGHGLVLAVACAVVEVHDLLGGHDDVVARLERVRADREAAPRRHDDVARELLAEALVPHDRPPPRAVTCSLRRARNQPARSATSARPRSSARATIAGFSRHSVVGTSSPPIATQGSRRRRGPRPARS